METIQLSQRVTVELHYDPNPESPETWDNLGQITGQITGQNPAKHQDPNEIARQIRTNSLIGLPVWAYVHSATVLRAANANPFTCPWDSGQSGWVYVPRKVALTTYGATRLTKGLRERIYSVLKAEVETFSQYLNGEVYGWKVLVDGEEVEACWGCYGYDYAREEGLSAAKHYWNSPTPLNLRHLSPSCS